MIDGQQNESAVPVGLEQVLLLAGVEPRFSEALRSTPDAALAASGVALSETERAILRTVPSARLEQMSEQLAAAATEPTRRAFLGHASAVVVALGVGAGLGVGCGEKKSGAGKATPDKEGGENMAAVAMAMERRRTVMRRHRVRAPTGIRPGPWPHTTVGDPQIKGPLDPKIVKRRLKVYANSAQRCWFRNGRHSPGGVILLELTVGAMGTVSKASFGAGTQKRKPNAIESCILNAARQWRFPPSKPKPTRIKVKYTFESRY